MTNIALSQPNEFSKSSEVRTCRHIQFADNDMQTQNKNSSEYNYSRPTKNIHNSRFLRHDMLMAQVLVFQTTILI